MKKHPILFKLIILGIVLILILGMINLLWYIGIRNRYNSLTKNMERTWDNNAEAYRYTATIDGFSCQIKMPSYLANNGFLMVSDGGYKAQYDENGNLIDDESMAITLHIWPQKFSGYKYGVSIYNLTTRMQIYLTADGEYISTTNGNTELDEKYTAVLDKYENEIDSLFRVAHQLWDLE